MSYEVKSDVVEQNKLFRKINITFKLWLFEFVALAFFLIIIVATGIMAAMLTKGSSFNFDAYGITAIAIAGVLSFCYWCFFVIKVIYQIFIFLSLRRLVAAETNDDKRALLTYMNNLILIILILYVVGMMTAYMFGLVLIAIFVLHILFFIKAKELKALIRE